MFFHKFGLSIDSTVAESHSHNAKQKGSVNEFKCAVPNLTVLKTWTIKSQNDKQRMSTVSTSVFWRSTEMSDKSAS